MVLKALSSVGAPVSSAVVVECHVGALIEIRFIGSPSMAEVVEFESKLVARVRQVLKNGKKPVICTDLRLSQLLEPEVSERMVALMKNDNPHVVRNAFLGQSSALITLQVHRFIGETGGRDRRRIFADEAPLVTWLSEVLLIPEQTRLRTFLKG